MELLLVRHAESLKNKRLAFAGSRNDSGITNCGQRQALETANCLWQFAHILALTPRVVHCSDSARSRATAKIIADRFKITTRNHDSLSSMKLARVSGMTEKLAFGLIPRFMSELSLYRAGVLNAYHMSPPRGSERHKEFEMRVGRQISQILREPGETLKIIVLHRSPLTAALINFARAGRQYPSNFYGHIPLDLAHVSWIAWHKLGSCEIRGVNLTASDLVVAGRRFVRWIKNQ